MVDRDRAGERRRGSPRPDAGPRERIGQRGRQRRRLAGLDRRVQIACHDNRIRQPRGKVGQRRDLATPLLAPDVREVGGHDADRARLARRPRSGPRDAPARHRRTGCRPSGWSTPAGSTWSSSAARGSPRTNPSTTRVAPGAHCPTSRTRPSRRSRDRRAGTRGPRRSGPQSPVHPASSAGSSTIAPSTFRIETSWSVTTSARSAATNPAIASSRSGGRVATRPAETARPARSPPGCSS